ARHYPQIEGADAPYLAFLNEVITRQAGLVANWMLVGFIHGVMNTDNMSISGETIDYGPCAFMDAYHPNTVFSSIDQFGRYAYGNQPGIAVWNLARLAEALLPLLHQDADEAVKLAENALKGFQAAYHAVFHSGLRRKIGLTTDEEGDLQLISDLLDTMSRNQADFTLTFRALAGEVQTTGDTRRLFAEPMEFDVWAERWRDRLAREPDGADAASIMRAVNPKYIPRNHRVEQVIQAAVEHVDFAPFEELLAVVTRPFDEQPKHEAYTQPPKEDERVLRTFCGT
ncbi:MAG: protein adenylyltransferase SelO family protein, partial [Rhizobiaceae bacterium]